LAICTKTLLSKLYIFAHYYIIHVFTVHQQWAAVFLPDQHIIWEFMLFFQYARMIALQNVEESEIQNMGYWNGAPAVL
jgi:hypothetical protein